MFCVGLTGTIASGKSTVAKIFASLGTTVISADKIAREITDSNKKILKDIANKFGNEILDNNGNLKRRDLRDIIFKNASDKIWLEQLLHPLIRKSIEDKINQCQDSYCIIEIPLLTNKTNFPYLNYVLLISSTTTKQINRLMNRDDTTEEQAHNILNSQPNKETYLAIADSILTNNGSIKDLEIKVATLDKQWRKK